MKIKPNRQKRRIKWLRKSKLLHVFLFILLLISNPILAQNYYDHWTVRPDQIGSTETMDLGNGQTAWHITYDTTITVSEGITLHMGNEFWYETDANNNPIGAGQRNSYVGGDTDVWYDTSYTLKTDSDLMNNINAAVEIALIATSLVGVLGKGLGYLYDMGYGYY